MAGDSFTHDQQAFDPGKAPEPAVISDDEARYADVVAQIIWDGALDNASSLGRMRQAAQRFGVSVSRAAQIEKSLLAAHQQRHKLGVSDEPSPEAKAAEPASAEPASEPDAAAPTPLPDALDDQLSPLAPSTDPRLSVLQRRIQVLETRNAELEGEVQRWSQQNDQLQNLVEQLQFALESTLEDLDRAGQDLAAQKQADEPLVDSQPGAGERAGEHPVEPPPPLESRTQAAVWPRPDEEAAPGDAPDVLPSEAEPSGVGLVPSAPPTLAARQRDNPVEIHRALEAGPRDRSLLHDLFDALGRAADVDRRWCIAQVLVFLDDATEGERALYEAYRLDGLARPRRAVNDDEWHELLMHPGQDQLTGEILAVIAPAVLLGHLTAIRASLAPEVLDPASRVEPAASTLQAVRCMHWGAAVLGLSTPPLYVCPEHDGAAEVVLNPAPSTRLGSRALSGRSTCELAFLAGEHLCWYRPEHLLGRPSRSLRRLEDMFLAALMIGNPGLPITKGIKERVGPIAKTISPLLDENSIEVLQQCFERFVEVGGRTSLSRWLRRAEQTCCRAGLLLSGDLWAAQSMLTVELDAAEQVDAAVDDLLVFFTSERSSALRQRIGIAVAGA